jgi:3D (Asp-Asp-Asp) domain-containing protein
VWVQFYEDGILQSEFRSASRRPLELLAAGQILTNAADEVYWQGTALALDGELPRAPFYIFEIRRAASVTIEVDGENITLLTTAPTVAEALAQAGVSLAPHDRVSAPLDGKPADSPRITVSRAQAVTIIADGVETSAWVTARSVGGALSEAGVLLAGLDFTQPPAEADLPGDGRIEVVRVRETVLLEQTFLPYSRQLQPDPELPLDQRKVLTPGQTGIEVALTRVTYLNGEETERAAEAAWTASEPQDEIVGYGQQVNLSTVDTEYGPLEYYRSVTMYATSYHPCAFSDGCHNTTRGGCALEKGVVAVSGAWYPYMVGQQVYIPGYGRAVVCDSGGGIPGRYWIDLGYSDDDYVGWYHWVSVYFLTPVPETILWILP